MNNNFAENFSMHDLFKGIVIFSFLAMCVFLPKKTLMNITDNKFVLNNIQFIVYAFLFLLTSICFFNKFKIKRSLLNESNLKYTCFCFLGILALMVISAIILDKIQIANNNEKHLEESANSGIKILFIITAVLLGPVVEEMIYRFCFFRFLFQYNAIFSHILVALIFGFMHCGSSYFKTLNVSELLNMIPYVFMSLGCSIAYVKTKSIIFPIMIHMAINSMATFN